MENIFLGCFAFGALFTLVSLVLGIGGHGAAHLAGHGAAHLGHGTAHLGHSEGAAVVSGHAAGSTHAPGDGSAHGAGRLDSLPLLNASSLIGGMTWFGAAGYLLLRLGDWALPAVLLGALIAAGVGWYLVARFLGLVLSGEREMDPEDYRLEGTVSQVTLGIPAGGTGEVVFSKAGARRSEAARAVGGTPIPRGTEVVITAYADGFATVQPWGEFLAAREATRWGNREAHKT